MIQIQIPYYFYCLLILMVTDIYYSAVEGFFNVQNKFPSFRSLPTHVCTLIFAETRCPSSRMMLSALTQRWSFFFFDFIDSCLYLCLRII